jgi:hypothetical protein
MIRPLGCPLRIWRSTGKPVARVINTPSKMTIFIPAL